MKNNKLFSWYSNNFPSYGLKNVSLFYLISIFSTAWFIISNWLFFALQYVTAYQFSIIEAVSFGLGLLLEIPSGAIADILGKKRTTQIGLFMQVFGSILFTLAHITPWFMIAGNIIIISAFAFISGSMEALVYDTMVQYKKEKHYDTVASRIGALSPFVFLITAFLGGILWHFNMYLPWIATIIAFTIACILSVGLKEPEVDTYQFSWKQFIQQNRIGFKQLLLPGIKPYLYIFISVAATYYMWGTGIIRILMGQSFGYNGETLSYLISIVYLISSIIVFNFDSIKSKIGNKKGLFLLTFISSLAWLLAGTGDGFILGFIVFLMITLAGNLHSPWKSYILNKHVPSKYRATTISTLQFFVQIPYVIVVIFFGILYEKGYANYFYYATSLMIFIALIISYWSKIKLRYQKNSS